MPIHVGSALTAMSEDIFREVAYEMTGIVFRIHNRYGSLFAEKLYKYEIAGECRELGLPNVESEVRIEVAFGDFKRHYYMDILIGGGALFELKAVSELNAEHRAQTLNYLFLTGLPRAKLFNLGSSRVQQEFVSTTLTHEERKRFSIARNRFRPLDSAGARFAELVVGLLSDWGSFLQLPLYYEAMTHFFGGEVHVIQRVPVVRDGVVVTDQRVHLLNDATAFKITAVSRHLEAIEDHLRRFLHHTRLRAIQWVNIHGHDITLTTLENAP